MDLYVQNDDGGCQCNTPIRVRAQCTIVTEHGKITHLSIDTLFKAQIEDLTIKTFVNYIINCVTDGPAREMSVFTK